MSLRTQISRLPLSPTKPFAMGLAVMMLSLTVSIQPVWDTFMLPWRIEFLASAVLLVFLSFGTSHSRVRSLQLDFTEWWLIVIPIIAFISWSALSAAWSNSPKSAAHHTLVWAIYLSFYICFRLLLQARNSYSQLLSALSLPLLFFSILAILGYFTILIIGRGSALGIIYSKWGEQVNTLLPLLLLAAIGARGKRFYLFTISLVLLSLMVYVSASRTAIGLFATGIIAVTLGTLVFKRFYRLRLRVGVVAVALLGTTVLLNMVPWLISDSTSPTVSRFSDKEHISGSNDFRKLMLTLGLEMIADKPMLGVGADNFGFEVNRYRSEYALQNPTDPTLSQAESNIPERAHNEYLQIASELGIVGAGIFCWFLIGVVGTIIRALKKHDSIPPHAFAASIALLLFLLSSLVTSYSFRLVQNGIVFFFVLAVLVRTVSKTTAQTPLRQYGSSLRGFRWCGVAVAICMMVLCGTRVASVILTKEGHSEPNNDVAKNFYDQARAFDKENPEPAYYLGIRLFKEGRFEESAQLIRESIRIGKASSADYSYLASAQFLAGNINGAEQSLAEAAVMYPHSVFVLARYSVILSLNGKVLESEAVANRARSIDSVSANTWLALIEFGSKKATELAFNDANYKAVMDLEPYDCIYAVISERDIRFPEERMKMPFELASGNDPGN